MTRTQLIRLMEQDTPNELHRMAASILRTMSNAEVADFILEHSTYDQTLELMKSYRELETVGAKGQ